MILAVNPFFKIIRKNNIRVFNIEMKFNTLVKRGYGLFLYAIKNPVDRIS